MYSSFSFHANQTASNKFYVVSYKSVVGSFVFVRTRSGAAFTLAARTSTSLLAERKRKIECLTSHAIGWQSRPTHSSSSSGRIPSVSL